MTSGPITRMASAPAGLAPSPSAVTVPGAEHSALELSTGAQTLGEMILRARRS